MKWATRSRIHVDRAACAWLIQRFIDPDATFLFVDDPADVPHDATAFDMRGARLSHRHGGCSFESALDDFDLSADPDEINNLAEDPKFAGERNRLEQLLSQARLEFEDPVKW